ncbi:acetoacetate--CoA ligase, partial [Streptomyces sp. JV178]|uniref:AMP-binding protein n=1 Tax=Streptomyces sp. JV178 TaxID=858632 RepID=UPI000C44D9BA
RLRAFGVRPGDRVCGYLPNVPQAAIAMLATTAVGAVWASASPDFGSRGVIDRFGQLRPKVLFCVDGYRYGGKTFDRRDEVRRIADALPGLDQLIHLPVLADGDPEPLAVARLRCDDVPHHPPVPAADFEFEHVPFAPP